MSRNAAVEDAAVTSAQPFSQAERHDLDQMTKPELLDFVEQHRIIVDGSWTKPQIIHALKTVKAAAAGFAVPKITSCISVINALSALVDQNAHFKPPANTAWGCNAPSDHVLRWMIEKGLPADLFQDGAALGVFLRVPENARQVKAVGIHVGFPPWQGKELLRVEKCDPGQYQRNDI